MRTRAAALRIALAGADESDILTDAAQLDLRGAKLEGLSGLRRALVLAGA